MIIIQAEVEKSSLHIMARCPSNEQQLLYVEERMNDILNLNEDLVLPGGITIYDPFWIFKDYGLPRFLSSPHVYYSQWKLSGWCKPLLQSV